MCIRYHTMCSPFKILELVSCSCKRSCNEKCPCFDNDFICTDACIGCHNNEGGSDNEADSDVTVDDSTTDDSDDG